MTEAQARARLERMLQWNVDPQLSAGDVTDLLALARRADRFDNPAYPGWSATSLYQAGDIVQPTTRNGHLYQLTVAGQTGAAEPNWPVNGGPVVDGGVTWKDIGLDPWVPTFELNAGAAEGWRWKAGKVAGLHDYGAGDLRSSRSQMYKACLEQAARYAAKIVTSVPTGPRRDYRQDRVVGNG